MEGFNSKSNCNANNGEAYLFVGDPSRGWNCPHCSTTPFHLRAPGSFSPDQPSSEFAWQHFAVCSGLVGHNNTRQATPIQVHQPTLPQQPAPPPTDDTPTPVYHWSHAGLQIPNQIPQQSQKGTQGPSTSGTCRASPSPPPPSQQGIPLIPTQSTATSLSQEQLPQEHPLHQHSTSGNVTATFEGMAYSPARAAFFNSSGGVAEEAKYFASPAASFDGTEGRIICSSTDEPVLPEDKPLLTDYFYLLIQQLKFCRFTERDRKSRGRKRDNLAIGFPGLECRHCCSAAAAASGDGAQRNHKTGGGGGTAPSTCSSRKFFWANVDRIANSFAAISDHVNKCRHCPPSTRMALDRAKVRHREQMAKLPKGSQKVFFRRMWRRLHPPDGGGGGSVIVSEGGLLEGGNAAASSKISPSTLSSRFVGPRGISSPHVAVGASSAAAVSANYAQASASTTSNRRVLAIPGDEQWLSDIDCLVRRSLEVFCASELDASRNLLDKRYRVNVGQVGIRCVYCASSSSAEGDHFPTVLYPQSINGIFESVRNFQRLHLDSCPNFPPEERERLRRPQTAASLPSVLRTYYVIAAKALGLYDCQDGIRCSPALWGGITAPQVGSFSPIGAGVAAPLPQLAGQESSEEGRERGGSSPGVSMSSLLPRPSVGTPMMHLTNETDYDGRKRKASQPENTKHGSHAAKKPGYDPSYPIGRR